MTTKHAHIVTRVNASQIKKEVINGEEHYRIPSATLPDNVVMNGGLYPADEIAASFMSLEGTPAPLGHPKVGNQFVPANSPHAINKHWIGAWNENVRRENGRVRLEKVVNIRVANQSEGGRQLIQAIEKQEPVHTSTGLQIQNIKVANGESRGKPYTWVAQNMQFDHDAILLGEPGAATPEEGVGMFVNASGEQADVMTCNLDLTEGDEYTLEAMAEEIVGMADRADRRERNKGLVDTIVQALKSAIGGAQSQSSQTTTANAKAPEGDMNEEQMKALLANALATITADLSEIKANSVSKEEFKPVADTVTELKTNAEEQKRVANAATDEQLKALGFDDEDLKGMTANAKQKVLAKQQPAQGFHINAAFGGNADKGPQDTLPE